MSIDLAAWPFAVSLLLAAIMGIAIQRGATCMVAAVDEIVARRRARRLAAMVGASLWVLAGLLLMQRFMQLPRAPAAYAASVYTVAGGALLGFGAYVGRACVFGAIARFGNGDRTYLLVPIGFYAGCVTLTPVLAVFMPSPRDDGSIVLGGGSAVLLAVLGVAVYLIYRADRRHVSVGVKAATGDECPRTLAARAWSPGVATSVIGIAFLAMMVLVGPWAYTDALADVARGASHDLASRGLLVFALFAGAYIGGRYQPVRTNATPTLVRAARCLASGLLMGWGSLLIPGGNDGLILVGMPLLFPYAWVAMASMAFTIALAMLVEQHVAARSTSPAKPVMTSRKVGGTRSDY